LRQYYGAANVFVTTPWYEPFGITPLEAMACARPVVGSAVGGIKSTVRDGGTGFLVPPRDPDALAERFARLLRDAALLERLGHNALQRARTHYTWDKVVDSVGAVYEEVLDRCRARRRRRAAVSRARSAAEAGSTRAGAAGSWESRPQALGTPSRTREER
jgi:glycogen synthase